MKALTLLCILAFSMLASYLTAQDYVTTGDYLEVTCMIVDSTETPKESFNINEPATYILSIRNISNFPISYKYSSKVDGPFTVFVDNYYSVLNNASSLSPYVIDAEKTLDPGEELSARKTVSEDKPGKYEFVVNPNFNFPKEYWPSTGPLYRVFDVVSSEEGN
jgi:hypothetical protein